VEGMFFFTNGGDQPGHAGMAMWWSGGKLYLIVRTATREWILSTPFSTVGTFVNIEFTWSVQLGLHLLFDGVAVADTTEFGMLEGEITIETLFLIGASWDQTIWAGITIEGWNVVDAVLEVIGGLDITVGKIYLLIYMQMDFEEFLYYFHSPKCKVYYISINIFHMHFISI
jgi:hypothetical protein